MQRYPNIKLVATTLREVHSTNRHDWAAVLWLNGKRYVSPTTSLDVIARVDASSRLDEGKEGELWLDTTKLHLFDPATGERLES